MGMPEVKISFQENAQNFIKRLGRGIVAVAFIGTGFSQAKVIDLAFATELDKALGDLPKESQEKVGRLVRGAFVGGARKVFAVCGKDVTAVTGALEGLRFNWLALGGLTPEDQETLATWAKQKDYTTGRTFILLGGEGLAKAKSGHVVALEGTYTTNEKVTSAFLAGIFAGLSDRSGTFYVVDEATDGTGYANRDQADATIDKGLLTVFYDGEKAKIGRAVTTAYAPDKKSAYAKIRNVDTMNMIVDDIKNTFYDAYVGQVLNDYDHKMGFVGQLNQVYLKGLEGSILDPGGINKVDLDLEKHAGLAAAEGMDVSTMTDQALRKYNTGEVVYLTGRLKLLDSMEDLYISFRI